MSLLQVSRLSVVRGRRTLFSDLSFGVDRATLITITGPNGSGKTTLLRTLAGLAAAASGDIAWNGERGIPRGQVAYFGHASALKDELSAEENLHYALTLAGNTATAAATRDALARAGLEAQRRLPAKRLSQGQRRRVHMARLFLSSEPLWLLDEPATALDAAGLDLLADTIASHVGRGGMALVATHQDLPIVVARHERLRLQ
jgi:heme exporter protein A